jgi:hypothetical protein
MGYCYEGSPICVPDGTPAPPDSPSEYVQTTRPGHRAPHAWLGQDKSMIDLFGRGFVLLRFGGCEGAGALQDAVRRRGVPLQTVSIDDPQIAALYEKKYVLVRPDGHVAWRADVLPDDPLGIIDQVRGAME